MSGGKCWNTIHTRGSQRRKRLCPQSCQRSEAQESDLDPRITKPRSGAAGPVSRESGSHSNQITAPDTARTCSTVARELAWTRAVRDDGRTIHPSKHFIALLLTPHLLVADAEV